MPASEFDKDFGYLMPFLDKVAGAAAGLQDPSARAELTKLVADEKQRWMRIRQLLSGASASTGSATAASSAAAVSRAAASTNTAPALTVGSLRPKRD